MKIAFVINEFPCLSETFILNQITGMLDLGHDVEIFATSASCDSKTHPDVEKYRLMQKVNYFPQNIFMRLLSALLGFVSNLPRHPVAVIKTTFLLLARREHLALRSLYLYFHHLGKRYDIIHCHFGPNGFFASSLKRAGADIRVLTTFHGYDINSYPNTTSPNVYDSLFKYGDLFTANTNFTKQKMIDLGCPEAKIKISPASLRFDRFPFCVRESSSHKPVRILTIGRLVEKKGYEYSIRALAKIVSRHSNVIYWVVGDGPLKNDLASLVAELAVTEHVQFMGALGENEILSLYQQADIFMLPSVTAANGDREGQALVLQEAQACGIPVISTIHNGIPDGVLDGESAFLVPEKDVEALAERLQYLIENPQKWAEMGRIGRDFVEKKYDTKIVNQNLLQIYQQLSSTPNRLVIPGEADNGHKIST